MIKNTMGGQKMSYKVTNKLEHPIRLGDKTFGPKETKILDEKPTSDRFHIEEVEKNEEPNKLKGGLKK